MAAEPALRDSFGTAMIHLLEFEGRSIPYSIRFSSRARRRRIVVRPGRVEIVAPRGDRERILHELIRERRDWVFRKLSDLTEREERIRDLTAFNVGSGDTIPYKGRKLPLRIHRSEERRIRVAYRTGFHVHCHHRSTEEEIRRELERWFRARLLADAAKLVRKYSPVLGVNPGGVTARKMKTRWGSCGRNGNINLNLKLVHLPAWTVEYVVVHELCHLRYRNHSKDFWNLVGSVLPEGVSAAKRLENELL